MFMKRCSCTPFPAAFLASLPHPHHHKALSPRPAVECVYFHRELKEKIQPEILELIKQQRLNRLVEGTCFRKLNSRRRQGMVAVAAPTRPAPWESQGRGAGLRGGHAARNSDGIRVPVSSDTLCTPRGTKVQNSRGSTELKSPSGPRNTMSLQLWFSTGYGVLIESLPSASYGVTYIHEFHPHDNPMKELLGCTQWTDKGAKALRW